MPAQALTAVSRSQAGVARAFILAAAIALVLALVASLPGGQSRYRRRCGAWLRVATRVDAGDLHPRIHAAEASAREVRVLADAFNHMLDRLDSRVRRRSASSSPTPRTSCARP